MQFNDRTIVITGGTSGIGQCLARTLRDRRNEVIVLGRAGERLDRMAEEGFATVPCDLGDPSSIENAAHQLAQRWSRVDVLFNNAGVQYNYDLTSEVLPVGRIHREIDIDLSGQILFTQLMLPLLSRSDTAMIVNTTSGLGAYPKADGLVYSAAKAGMRSFTVGLRNVLRRTPIRVLLDGRLRVPASARLFAPPEECMGEERAGGPPENRTWIVCAAGRRGLAAARRRAARVIEAPSSRNGHVDLVAVFERLAEAGLTTVLVEGGGSLAAALLRADLVDEVHWMLAPKLIGGDGRAALGPLERTRLADAVSIEPIRVRRLGQDLHVHGRVRRPIERAASTRRTSRKRSRREGA